MDDKEKWLQERKQGIGGSDAAAVCGVSPYRTPLQVWEDKRDLSGAIPDNPAMEWGRILEPVVRQKYSDVTGRIVRLPKEKILSNLTTCSRRLNQAAQAFKCA